MKVPHVNGRFFFGIVGFCLLMGFVVGCGDSATLSSQEVVTAFQSAGLEAEASHKMTQEDYGVAPMVGEGIRFLIPSMCLDCGGRVIVTATEEEAIQLETFYKTLGEENAILFSWVFRNDNIVVQINGDLEENEARRYNDVLMVLAH